MSTLAAIFVKQCDACKQVVVIKSDPEWASFQTLWHEGFDLDFCYRCRDKDEVKRRIDSDELHRQTVVEKAAELSEKTQREARVEYAH